MKFDIRTEQEPHIIPASLRDADGKACDEFNEKGQIILGVVACDTDTGEVLMARCPAHPRFEDNGQRIMETRKFKPPLRLFRIDPDGSEGEEITNEFKSFQH